MINTKTSNQTIVLIGMSGCGKTTYTNKLKEQLKCNAVDLDEHIEAIEGLKISEIFAQKGEDYFRTVEWREFLKLLNEFKGIIATGAGLVPHAVTKGLEKPENAKFIFLNTPIETICKNLSKPEELAKRPLLASADDVRASVLKQASLRMDSYMAWADEIVTEF